MPGNTYFEGGIWQQIERNTPECPLPGPPPLRGGGKKSGERGGVPGEPAERRGKSGGVRVIYYFYDEEWPVFLLQLYAKGEKADLTAAERKTMGKLALQLKHSMRRERGGKDMR
jgi:mRNA-degrading endonuclease RelE of RelBE toxin-antitoxin system